MSLVQPTRYVASIDLLDLDDLWDLGYRCILVDRDNTLVPRDTKTAPEAVRAWIAQAQEVGMKVCMVSNNFHSKDVCASAVELGVDVVHHAMKPAPFAVRVALAKEGVPAERALLVGDQLFTDVMAGNLAGVKTVLVRPQSQEDIWYTQLFRKVERLFLRNAPFEGE